MNGIQISECDTSEFLRQKYSGKIANYEFVSKQYLMMPTFYNSKQNFLYWTEEQLHKQPLDDSTSLNGSLNRWTITVNCHQYVNVLRANYELNRLGINSACFQQDGSIVHKARQRDKKTDILRIVSKTPPFRSWMASGVQHITWPAITHNLTMPDFSLHCFLEPFKCLQIILKHSKV
jgi:hypothetical protein